MKDFNQLREDVKTNGDLAKKLEEADKQMRKSIDKGIFIKAAAELGYEVTEQDISGKDDLVKLDEEELDNVAGGLFGFGEEAPDGHEIGCFANFSYYLSKDSFCPKRWHDGHEYSFWNTDPQDDDYEIYRCKLCGKETFRFVGGAVE